ncbi:MAG TPA: integrase arm-type DNA-binding domain-containing protein [Hyphomicrobium sp.]|nr:integrase arm-type DNA-binding domain-containing protein [Hyphomicrobium sp.]
MASGKLTDKAVAAAKALPGKRLELWDTGTPGLCLRVSEGGRKMFLYRYRTIDGRQPRLTLGAYSSAYGLAEARADADRIKVQVRDGEDPAGEKRRERTAARAQPLKTFDDLADAFLTASELGHWKPRKKRKRERTISDERAILKRHARPTLGERRLEEIDRHVIRSLLRDMAGRNIGAQTNRTHAVIRQVFAYGVAEERLKENPAAGIAPVVAEKPRTRVLTDAELKALWAGINNPTGLKLPPAKKGEDGRKLYVGRPMAIALQLAALLLQRRGEIVGMQVDELDLDNGIWTIPAERMKGGVAHVVPLPARAVELIREALRLIPESRKNNAPVFPGARDPAKSVRPDSLTHAMTGLMVALGMKSASPHDLRRTAATAMASERLSVSPFVVSRVLAHRSDAGGGAAVTLAHYNLHDYAPEKRRALEAWEGLLLEIVGEKMRPDNVRQIGEVR